VGDYNAISEQTVGNPTLIRPTECLPRPRGAERPESRYGRPEPPSSLGTREKPHRRPNEEKNMPAPLTKSLIHTLGTIAGFSLDTPVLRERQVWRGAVEFCPVPRPVHGRLASRIKLFSRGVRTALLGVGGEKTQNNPSGFRSPWVGLPIENHRFYTDNSF
jgi:hypothetical protein